MIAKITKGADFRGAIKYILDSKKETEIVAAYGLRMKDVDSVVDSFLMQQELNPRISKPVGHISLDFSAQDSEKLDNVKMLQIALDYMKRMGICNTQFIIGRHHDKEHPHIHIIYNRVDNNGRVISDQNDRLRSHPICKELTKRYGLYLAEGKENVKRHRLREPDATKYRIYDALVKNVPLSNSWGELRRRLRTAGIEVGFKMKGSTSQIEGVRFTANDLTFNGSKVDKQFSFSKIDYSLKQNAREELRNSQSTQYIQSQQKHSAVEEIVGTVGEFLDLPFKSHGTDYEEEQFRKRMQKKKKGIRR